MKTQKQLNIIKYGLAGIVLCAVFVATSAIRAGVGENLAGWAWGGNDDSNATGKGVIASGLGWLSMNNTNAGGGVSYGVNVPLADGDLTGTAYSENLGYIAFDNSGGYLAGCPDGNCVAKRVGNSLQGWARFVEIAKASAIGNSGGWSGWIKLNGLSYGVTIGSDGKLSGSAWSDELGWISFSGLSYGATIAMPIVPTVSITANPSLINIETYPDWKTVGVPITLSWDITNATTCTKSWSVGGVPVVNGVGTETIPQTSSLITYSITCVGPGGITTTGSTLAVMTYCNDTACVNGTCEATAKVGAVDISECTNKCVAGSSCANNSLKVKKWTEVAPID